MAGIKLVGFVWGWSSSRDLKDDTYILSPFENKFIKLKPSEYQGFLSLQGFLTKFKDFY